MEIEKEIERKVTQDAESYISNKWGIGWSTAKEFMKPHLIQFAVKMLMKYSKTMVK